MRVGPGGFGRPPESSPALCVGGRDDDEILVDGGNRRRVQRQSGAKRGWTKKRYETFLVTLAETCNVSLSSKRAGMSTSSAYRARHRDLSFAGAWDEALAIGYDRLEALLLQRAIEGVNDIDVAALIDTVAAADERPAGERDGDASPGPGIRAGFARVDVQLALDMLKRRGAKDGLRVRGRKAMSSDEVDVLLIKKLDALARRRSRP